MAFPITCSIFLFSSNMIFTVVCGCVRIGTLAYYTVYTMNALIKTIGETFHFAAIIDSESASMNTLLNA